MFDKKLLLEHIQNRPKHIEEQFIGLGDAVKDAKERARMPSFARANPKDEGGKLLTGDAAILAGANFLPDLAVMGGRLATGKPMTGSYPDAKSFRPLKDAPVRSSGIRLPHQAVTKPLSKAITPLALAVDVNDIISNLGQLGKTERQLAGGSKGMEVPEDPTGLFGGYNLGDVAYGAASLAGEDPVQRQLDRAQSAQDRVQSRDARDYRARVRQSGGEYARSPEGREHYERLTQGTKWEGK